MAGTFLFMTRPSKKQRSWCRDTAAEAKLAAKAFRAGKLKSQSVESVIARLRAAK
jgi:hypothetical protein